MKVEAQDKILTFSVLLAAVPVVSGSDDREGSSFTPMVQCVRVGIYSIGAIAINIGLTRIL